MPFTLAAVTSPNHVNNVVSEFFYETIDSVIMNGPWLRWLYNVSTKKNTKIRIF